MLTRLCVLIMVILFEINNADDAFVPSIPIECLKLGYCEHVPGYPEKLAEELVNAMGDNTNEYLFNDPGLAAPIRRDPNEVILCEAYRKFIIPKAAKDREGKWHFVLNPKNKTMILFHVEICNNLEGPCNAVAVFPIGYKATCEQKFIERTMVVIDEQGVMERRLLLVPSDCYCKVMGNILLNKSLFHSTNNQLCRQY